MVSALKIYEVLDLMPRQTPMDKDQSEIYIKLSMIAMKRPEQLLEEVTDEQMIKELHKQMPISIFIRRAENLNLDVTVEAAMMLGLIAESPGSMVLYLAYLAGYVHTHKKPSKITLQTIGMDLFPMGFFSDEDLHHAWLKQKRERNSGESFSDNWLDSSEAWEPLTKEQNVH